ncbi:hypothetical protein SCB49_10222 [unidentified eubacterium SCB49]|nr:hypothetical protein SCB49_10222 [unidentified eubacterium SCB49]
MELEELQQQWNVMSKRVDSLEIVTKQQIMEITNQKYKNRFKSFWLIEFTGAIVCLIMAVVILFNMSLMNTIFLKICAITLLLSLIIMPVLTLKSLYKVKSLNWSLENYKTVLIKFQKSKKRLLQMQRLAIPFTVFVFFTTIPVFNKIMGKEALMERLDLKMSVLIGVVLVFIILFALWGNSKYKKSLAHTEKMIAEVEGV